MNDDIHAHDDEIVSAVLDGEATADEHERVASDPGLMARLDAFRRVSEAVAAPVEPLDEVARRRLLDRALDAVEPQGLPSTSPGSASRRPRPSWGLGGAAAVASVAVVALLALVGGPALLQASGGDDDVASAPTAEDAVEQGEAYLMADGGVGEAADDMAPEAVADTADLDGAGTDGTTEMSAATPRWIGSYAAGGEFAAAARQQAARSAVGPSSTSTAPIGGSGSDPQPAMAAPECPPELIDDATERIGGPVEVVAGEIDGRPVAGVVAVDDPDWPVVVVDLVDCTVTSLE